MNKMVKKVVINLENIWRTYQMGENKLDVLKGINLKVHDKEFVVIIGPSGSGKSTLMNQIGVLDTPTKGKIYLSGVDISTLTESELANLRGQKIGFIFQQFNLVSTLTALENVILPTIFQNMDEEERLEKAKELLKLVGLEDRMDHKPNELSGGQQQRVAIARALINDPEIILADEPTGNLDTASGNQIMDLLKQLHHKKGKTIILITHDTELLKFAQTRVHLRDGVITSKK
jgi:putative ABC transport system ATP-binding protein